MKVRQWMRIGCFALAAGLTIGGLVVPSSAQTIDESARPPAFQGFGFATPLQLQLNTDPPQTIPELVHLDIPHGQVTFGAGSQSQASAAQVFAGALGKLPNFFCTLGFPCANFPGFPPQWPFLADAEYPFAVDAEPTAAPPTIEGGGQFALRPGQAKAHAGRDFADADAVVADFNFINAGTGALSADTALIHVGSAQAKAHSEFDSDGVLVTTARSVLGDISIAAGQLTIDSIETVSVARTDGDGVTTATPRTVVTGVTLAGNPATLGPEGLEVAGSSIDQNQIPAITSGLSTLLTNGSVVVRLIDDSSSTDGAAVADSLGVLVEFKLDGSGLPGGTALVGNVMLGAARASSFASLTAPDAPVVPDTSGFPAPEPVTPTLDQVLSGGVDSPGFLSPSVPTPTEQPIASPAPTVVPAVPQITPVPSGASTISYESLSGDVAKRVTWFYGAGAVALLGLALGPHLPFNRLR